VLLHPKSEPTGTILVADDQATNRELLAKLLTTQGFTVITVSDGAEALDQLTKVPVDLAILDVLMPRMNGFEACRKIKANTETYLIPVVLVTALSDKQDRIEGLRASADDFLTRPVDRAELLARVQSLIKLKQRTDELERAECVLFALARSLGQRSIHERPLRTVGTVLGFFGTSPRSCGRTGYRAAESWRGS